MSLQTQLPIIDLSLPDTETAPQVRSACATLGFFYVTNHGIPQSLIDSTFAQTRRFFALPLEEKLKIQQDKNNRGYQAFNSEILDLADSNLETKERLYLGIESPKGNRPFAGPNQWPDATKLPKFRPTMEEFFDRARKFARERLMAIVLKSLGLESTALDEYLKVPIVVLGPLHYSAELSDPENGKFGAGAHRDYGFLSLIVTQDVNGLQVQNGDQWLDVPHRDGAIVVNLGEMMHRFTNGLYKAALHRVINNHGRERYSLPFFYDPDVFATIEPCPKLIKDGDKKLEPVRYLDFLYGTLKATNMDFAG